MKDDFLLELKSRLDIVDVISEYLTLQKTGSNYKARCPFHSEKTPSFVVSQEKQIFRCFGCGVSGDLITFVSKIEGLSFQETIEKLAVMAGMELPKKKKINNTSAKYEEFYKITATARDFFYKNLEKSEFALKYLNSRQISLAVREEFSLGYALDTWDALYKYFLDKKLSLPKATELGLLGKKEKGYYDIYRNRIIFPIHNVYGQVLAFGGRILGNDDKTAKYINSRSSVIYDKSKNLFGLYHSKQDIRKQGYAIVVEGYLDLLSLFGAGIRNVVATLGTAFTKEQAVLLKRFTKTIILLYDGDQAGVDAAKKSLALLLGEEFSVKAVFLDNGQDPDDFIKTHSPEDLLGKLKEAGNLLDFVIDDLFKDAFSTEERVKATKKAISYLLTLKDEEYVMSILDKLSVRGKIAQDRLLKYFRQVKAKVVINKDNEKHKVKYQELTLESKSKPLYVRFVKAIYEIPELALSVFDEDYEQFLPKTLTNFAKLVRDSLDIIKENKDAFFTNMGHSVPEWVNSAIHEEILIQNRESGRSFAREFEALIIRFKIEYLEVKKSVYVHKLEKSNDAVLLEEYKDLLKEIKQLKDLVSTKEA